MDTKKIQDTLALLEHQLDSANQRLEDSFYDDIKEWLIVRIEKLEIEIHKLKLKL